VFVARTRAVGEPGEHRDQRNRLDDDEEHDEKLQGLFEHDALRKKFVLVSDIFREQHEVDFTKDASSIAASRFGGIR
jgi:hypothetical protein